MLALSPEAPLRKLTSTETPGQRQAPLSSVGGGGKSALQQLGFAEGHADAKGRSENPDWNDRSRPGG
eukprot:4614082-Alexandrium_andersonii.AAC.1